MWRKQKEKCKKHTIYCIVNFYGIMLTDEIFYCEFNVRMLA